MLEFSVITEGHSSVVLVLIPPPPPPPWLRTQMDNEVAFPVLPSKNA